MSTFFGAFPLGSGAVHPNARGQGKTGTHDLLRKPELDAHVIGRFNVEVGKVRVEVRLRDGALRWRALSKSKRGDRSTDSRCLTREGDT